MTYISKLDAKQSSRAFPSVTINYSLRKCCLLKVASDDVRRFKDYLNYKTIISLNPTRVRLAEFIPRILK